MAFLFERVTLSAGRVNIRSGQEELRPRGVSVMAGEAPFFVNDLMQVSPVSDDRMAERTHGPTHAFQRELVVGLLGFMAHIASAG